MEIANKKNNKRKNRPNSNGNSIETNSNSARQLSTSNGSSGSSLAQLDDHDIDTSDEEVSTYMEYFDQKFYANKFRLNFKIKGSEKYHW